MSDAELRLFWDDHRKDMEDPEYAEAFAAAQREIEKLCEECGKPEGSFACKIRHIHMDHSWAKGDH